MVSSEPACERLLLFNLRTDVDDHILGFTTAWINALAQHYGHIDVLTMHRGRVAVAPNVRVYSAGRERGYSAPRRAVTFYAVLADLLLRHRYDACFAHMTPLFAAMAGPLLTLRGVRTTTWYTHRQVSRQLRWALRMSHRIATAVPSSFPIASSRVRAVGHGIDTDFYAPSVTASTSQRPLIVQVARLTAIKHQHILLQAAAELDCEVVFVGDIPDGYDDSYKRELMQLAQAPDLAGRVTFAGAQTPQQVRDWYHHAVCAVNLSPAGLFDKAALEGMACGLPTIVSNPAFDPVLGDYAEALRIPTPDDVTALRDRLQHLLSASPAERAAAGARLRQRVIDEHSLARLIPRLVSILQTGEPDAVGQRPRGASDVK